MSRVGIKVFFVLAIFALVAIAGCGEGDETTEGGTGQARIARHASQQQAAARRAKIRRQARAAERRRRQAVARRQHQAEMRQIRAEEVEQRAAERAEDEAAEEEASECDPNYSGACLDPYASDYDCEGGSGDGPEYAGTVTVVGEDHYGLDSDSDGIGCEPY